MITDTQYKLAYKIGLAVGLDMTSASKEQAQDLITCAIIITRRKITTSRRNLKSIYRYVTGVSNSAIIYKGNQIVSVLSK